MKPPNRGFVLAEQEVTRFVMDSAKEMWYQGDDKGKTGFVWMSFFIELLLTRLLILILFYFIAALKLLKSELEYKYSEIKQMCCLESARMYLAQNNENELTEIAHALSLKIPNTVAKLTSNGSISVPG